jgi:hypothetical protein
MFISHALGHALSLSLLLTIAACDGGGESKDKKSIASAIDPAAEKAAKAAAEKKALDALPPKAADPKAPAWSFDDVRNGLKAGTKLVYTRTGVDGKGKKVDDVLTYVLRSASSDGAGTSFTIEPNPGSNDASSQVATMKWSSVSPFFAMENPEVAVSGRESVTVKAGTFEVAVAELKDFFGNEKSVWMILDKPGIYAKVVDRGNADPEDKTEITSELTAIEAQ